MLTCDTYHIPTSLPQALDMLNQQKGKDVRILAGATDTLPWARQGRAGDVTGDHNVKTIIDVTRLPELRCYEVKAGRLRMGAGLVFQDFLEDEALSAHLPNMRYCAIWFADDQIRRQATLAGNLANASPAADGTPPMVALNGEVELASLAGSEVVRRHVPVSEFITGPGKTTLADNELITAVTCDSAHGFGGSFEKVGQRRSLVISVACATCCVKVSADGQRFEDIRLALGGVGPVPIRLDDAENKLRGSEITRQTIAEAAKLAPARVASRSRRDYRKEVIQGFTERAIIDALADCGHGLTDKTEELAHV